MSDASHDERIRTHIEAAADAMPDAPVRWKRVTSLARRRMLISLAAALALAVLVAVLLATAGNYGSLGLHGSAPFPFVGGVSVPDVRGMVEARAVARLADAGLTAVNENQCPPGRSCFVSQVQPDVGANVPSGASVDLRLSALLQTSGKSHGRPHGGHSTGSGHRSHSDAKPPSEGEAKPRKIDLSLSTTMAIPANGRSTIVVRALVLDARGNSLSGQSVDFSSRGSQDKIVTARPSNAVYTATITSSAIGGPVTVEARDGAIVATIVFQQTCPEAEAPGGQGEPAEEVRTTTTTQTTTTTSTTPTKTGIPCTAGGGKTGTGTTGTGTTGTGTTGTGTTGTGTTGTGTTGTGTTGTGTIGTATGATQQDTGTGTTSQGTGRGEPSEVG